MSESAAGLRSAIRGGLAWNATSQIVLQVTRIAVAVLLARLLAPHDYGIAAMVLVFASLVLVFADMALGAALIQRPTLTEADRSTAFWMTITAGAVFTVAGIALSWPLAAFYQEPEVRDLCIVLSFSFLITAVGATQRALLVRDMQFRSLEIRLMSSTLVGAAAAAVLALLGAGPWAIIGQQLAQAVVSTVLLWVASSWRPRLLFSRASLRNLGGFSSWLVGHRLLYYLHRNADNILIGRFLGAASLGAYSLAYNVMLVPFSRIAAPVQKVLAPAFARLQNEPQQIAAAWISATRILGAIAIPALAGLVVVAPDFVHVVLGERWSQATPLIQILAWVGILQALQTLNTDILQARDRTSTVFRFTVLFTGAHIVAFVIGLQWGVVGVAVAYAISSTLVEPIYTVLTARELGISPLRILECLSGVIVAAAVMAATVFGARLGLIDAGLGPAGRLGICILVGATVYTAMCLWRVPEIRSELRGLRPRRVRTPAPTSQIETTQSPA
jgi:O-antigen/teichoic acid export membrane protein